MRIDTFKGQDKRLLFWEDGDSCAVVKEHMRSNNVSGLVFSRYLGFRGDMVDINESFDFVDEINILETYITDISFIKNFPNVKILNIQNDDRTKLDLSIFPKLEDIFLVWRKGVINLFNHKNIKKIRLEGYKEKVLSFGDDMELEELEISVSPVEDLTDLNKLQKLRRLQIAHLRCLEDSLWLRNLKNLEVLNISSCKKLANSIPENMTGLRGLKKLSLIKMGEIPTIKFISQMNNIEEIDISEGTIIADGDLSPLLELPNLKYINIQGFKHYNPSAGSIKSSIVK
jgi:Leucine-rich repeat (LRR) protein